MNERVNITFETTADMRRRLRREMAARDIRSLSELLRQIVAKHLDGDRRNGHGTDN